MKAGSIFFISAALFYTLNLLSQGTFVYDQQSADESSTIERAPAAIQSFQPIGQSLTPSLSAIGFVRLILSDEHGGNNLGATVFLNLRQDSMSGTVIGTSQAVSMPDNFGLGGNTGYVDFLFSTPVAVNPGTTYYVQPIVQTGDSWGVSGSLAYNYTGGVEYQLGQPFTGHDLWFREGIIIPEPSTWILLALGVGALLLRRRKAA